MAGFFSRADEREKKAISGSQADDFKFRSRADQPISSMTMLRRSLLMAEISMISYLSLEQCNKAAGKLGFTGGKYFSKAGGQAYWFWNDRDSVVVFRGTEPNQWADIKADANALTALAETVGRVHRGFKRETGELWPVIEKALEDNSRPLWFAGHSLGGAMATIAAAKCLLSYIRSEPEELYTFGSPRVGCKLYVNHAPVRHFRWVNNNDIVTRVPPVWLGYRHGGQEIYIDRHGKIRKIAGWKRISDRLKGFLGGLLKFRVDQLTDHSTLDYIAHIHEAVRLEESGRPTGVEDSQREVQLQASSNPALPQSGDAPDIRQLAESSGQLP